VSVSNLYMYFTATKLFCNWLQEAAIVYPSGPSYLLIILLQSVTEAGTAKLAEGETIIMATIQMHI
jgi:hypothetical protein